MWMSNATRTVQDAGVMTAMEAEVMQALGQPHPNIIPFYGWMRKGSADYLVMEAADYGSLEELLHTCKSTGWMFSTSAKVSMCQQIAAAMARLAEVKACFWTLSFCFRH